MSSLSEIQVVSGSNAVLQCILDGDPSHGGSFTWTGPAVGSGRVSISLDGSGTVSTLVISSAGQSDEGRYGCSYTGRGAVFITLDVIILLCNCIARYRCMLIMTALFSIEQLIHIF